MDAGIECAGQRATGLAHPHPGHAAGHNHNAQRQQNWSPSQQSKCQCCPPTDLRLRGQWLGFACFERQPTAGLQIQVMNENPSGYRDHSDAAPGEQILQEQHTASFRA